MSTGSSATATDGELLTVQETAQALRVSKWTVYRLIKAGDLAASRVGRAHRVPVTAIRALLTPTTEAA